MRATRAAWARDGIAPDECTAATTDAFLARPPEDSGGCGRSRVGGTQHLGLEQHVDAVAGAVQRREHVGDRARPHLERLVVAGRDDGRGVEVGAPHLEPAERKPAGLVVVAPDREAHRVVVREHERRTRRAGRGAPGGTAGRGPRSRARLTSPGRGRSSRRAGTRGRRRRRGAIRRAPRTRRRACARARAAPTTRRSRSRARPARPSRPRSRPRRSRCRARAGP